MEIKELYWIIQNYYGYKAHMRYINSDEKKVWFFLYDAFSSTLPNIYFIPKQINVITETIEPITEIIVISLLPAFIIFPVSAPEPSNSSIVIA